MDSLFSIDIKGCTGFEFRDLTPVQGTRYDVKFVLTFPGGEVLTYSVSTLPLGNASYIDTGNGALTSYQPTNPSGSFLFNIDTINNDSAAHPVLEDSTNSPLTAYSYPTLPDGFYTLKYVFDTSTGDEYSGEKEILNLCNAKNCYLSMTEGDCPCETKELSDKAEQVFALITRAETLMDLGKTEEIPEIIEALKAVCAGEDCDCSCEEC